MLADLDDRHLLEAAIVGRCDAIVFQTDQDLPPKLLAPFGIKTRQPYDLFRNRLSLVPRLVRSALRKICARLKNPPKSVDKYLSILTQQGLVATVADQEQSAEPL